MKSKLKAVIDDERGVSPVIGVILMVAITVILAAVIGTFVLGLGDSLETAPQAQLDAEAVDTDGDGTVNGVNISHNGGDAITETDYEISIQSAGGSPYESGDSGYDITSSDGEFGVGDTITITGLSSLSDDKQVQVIHTPSESIILDTEVTFP